MFLGLVESIPVHRTMSPVPAGPSGSVYRGVWRPEVIWSMTQFISKFLFLSRNSFGITGRWLCQQADTFVITNDQI